MTRGLRMGAGRGRWQSRSLCNTWWLVGLVRGSVRAWILTFALTILSLGAHAAELTDVRFSAQPGNRVEIQLIFSAPVQAPSAFDTISPARIALDFPGVGNRLDRRAVPIGVGAVHSLVAVQSSDRARVVINLNDPVPYQVAVEGNLVRVELDTQAGVAGPSQIGRAHV